MIELTRLNGRPMVVNSDLIKTAEASPDTMLTLINGEKLIVREGIAEVVEKILAYRAAAGGGGKTVASFRRSGASGRVGEHRCRSLARRRAEKSEAGTRRRAIRGATANPRGAVHG